MTNVTASQPVAPTGALLHFYQTLPGTAEVPYEIVTAGLNPLTGRFTDNLPLAGADLYFGTYTAGQAVALTATAPQEGDATYRVFADASQFVRGAATADITANDGSTVVGLRISGLSITGSATATSISGAVTQTAGHFDNGYLVATHNGGVVTSLALNSALAANGRTGGAFTLDKLPGGTSARSFTPGLYTIFVLVWNSTDPTGTVRRLDFISPVDLSQGSATNVAVTLN